MEGAELLALQTGKGITKLWGCSGRCRADGLTCLPMSAADGLTCLQMIDQAVGLQWKVAPALVAGNTVVLKPSEVASVTCLELGDIASQAGLPPGVLNIITGLGTSAGAPLRSSTLPLHSDARTLCFLSRVSADACCASCIQGQIGQALPVGP